MALSHLSYNAKIDATINKLPLSHQPLFQAALVKHSFNLKTFSSNTNDIRSNSFRKNKSRNDNEAFFKKYMQSNNKSKKITKTFSKETELFKNLHNKIKRDNNQRYHLHERDRDKEVQGEGNDNDLFLPSILLDKPENSNSITLTLYDKNEVIQERDLVEKYSDVMMNIRKNKHQSQLDSSNIYKSSKKKSTAIQSNIPLKQLYKENRRLIREIGKSCKTFKSLSELPEYCITSVESPNSSNKSPKSNEVLLLPHFSPQIKKHQAKIRETRPRVNIRKPAQKIALASLYEKLQTNQLLNEYPKVVKYFKRGSKSMNEPMK